MLCGGNANTYIHNSHKPATNKGVQLAKSSQIAKGSAARQNGVQLANKEVQLEKWGAGRKGSLRF